MGVTGSDPHPLLIAYSSIITQDSEHTMKPILIAIGFIIAFTALVSTTGVNVYGIPIFALCVGLALLIQWLAFIPAYKKQTERYYDLMGSTSFILVTLTALILADRYDDRSLLLAVLVIIWALRLGNFLFRRVHQDGGDDRFENIKPNAKRFFLTWTLQGLWVSITAATAFAAISAEQISPLTVYDINAVAIWLIGFTIEVVADRQKREHRASAGKDEFISTGLWAYSRHPNYFGEILLWIGVALLAVPALQGLAYLSLLSPVFVYLLLTRISGIPMLEKKAEKKWGHRADYQDYKKRTRLLVPLKR
jgi:steroid 5-alpha reductase family enzyme